MPAVRAVRFALGTAVTARRTSQDHRPIQRSVQRTTCNEQCAACNIQRATCMLHVAACSVQHTACNTQHAAPAYLAGPRPDQHVEPRGVRPVVRRRSDDGAAVDNDPRKHDHERPERQPRPREHVGPQPARQHCAATPSERCHAIRCACGEHGGALTWRRTPAASPLVSPVGARRSAEGLCHSGPMQRRARGTVYGVGVTV